MSTFHCLVCSAWTVTLSAGLFAFNANAVTVMRDAVQGAGFATVDGGLPLILGAPAVTPLEVDVVFNDMKHIELFPGASTNVEFGIGNTGNTADLNYRIVFDLSDMDGNLITNEALVVEDTAQAGFIDIQSLPLTPLPPVVFHDFHIRVETSFVGNNTGSDRFDLFVGGGGGDLGTAVSGPVRFNRAVVGEWIPEPASASLLLIGVTTVGCLRRRHQKLATANVSGAPVR